MMIRGLYKIPFLKTAFLIVSFFPSFSDSLEPSLESKKRTGYIGRTLRSKDRKFPKEIQQWTLKVVSEHDFLQAIALHKPKGVISPNQTCDNPIQLELLTINLPKTPENLLDWTYSTPKGLGLVPEEDVIEVFI